MKYSKPSSNQLGRNYVMMSPISLIIRGQLSSSQCYVNAHKGVGGKDPTEVLDHGNWGSSWERIHIRDVGAIYACDPGTSAYKSDVEILKTTCSFFFSHHYRFTICWYTHWCVCVHVSTCMCYDKRGKQREKYKFKERF